MYPKAALFRGEVQASGDQGRKAAGAQNLSISAIGMFQQLSYGWLNEDRRRADAVSGSQGARAAFCWRASMFGIITIKQLSNVIN